MSSNPYTKFKLNDEEHREIYQEQIRPELIAAESVDKPRAVIIAGQPGAGKSAITSKSKKELASHGGSVTIDIDELRNSHPEYTNYQAKNNREAAGMVQHDASKWGKQLLNDSIKERKNIILDGTLKRPESAELLSKQLKSAGYDVTVRAMAVSTKDSELSIHARYEDKLASGKPGRWVPLEIHQKASSGMVQSIDRLNEGKLVDNIEIHGRSLSGQGETRILYAGKSGAGNPVKALNDERSRPKEPQEQHKFNNDTRRVAQQITQRDAKLSEPENRAFIENVRNKNPNLLPKHLRPAHDAPSLKLNSESTNSASGARPKMDIKAALAMGKRAVAENGSVINKEINKIQNEKAVDQKPKQEPKQEHIKKPSKGPEIVR